MAPFGLGHAAPLPPAFTAALDGVGYDHTRQISTVAGEPAVNQPAALARWAVSWGDTQGGDTLA